jgi:hypothetical protein
MEPVYTQRPMTRADAVLILSVAITHGNAGCGYTGAVIREAIETLAGPAPLTAPPSDAAKAWRERVLRAHNEVGVHGHKFLAALDEAVALITAAEQRAEKAEAEAAATALYVQAIDTGFGPMGKSNEDLLFAMRNAITEARSGATDVPQAKEAT